MTDDELYRRGQRAELLLNDETLKSALNEVKQDQIAIFVQGSPADAVMEAQSIVVALHTLEQKLQSYVDHKLILDNKNR